MEAQLARDRPAVGVEVDPRQGAGAERQHAGLALGEGEALTVAREHPEVGEQVMGEIDRLRALQMGVAGHGPVQVLLRARQQDPHQLADRDLRGGRALARVHGEIGHHLVVARARGVQPPAHGPCDLGQAALDGHVDVLVPGRELEAVLAQLLLDRVKSRQQRLQVLGGDHAALGQHPRVRPRGRHILRPQAAIEADRGVEALEGGVLGLVEAGHGRSV